MARGDNVSESAVNTDSLPLFVFGTLRRGEPNHRLLAGRYVSVRPAVLPGYAIVGPLMIARVPGGVVAGELFDLDPARRDETRAAIDRLEGIGPGETVGDWYRRERVTVEVDGGPREAFAYVAADSA